MITINEEIGRMFIDKTKKETNCPFCKVEITFYGLSPDRCPYCKELLINYISLLFNCIYRTNYHRGVVDKSGDITIGGLPADVDY
jgi:hypothetical protein